MDDKEKARLYDEALNQTQKYLFETNNRMSTEFYEATKRFMESIFPELAESEDEKVRKEIIEVLRFVPSSMWEQAKTNYERCFAYLEKQKEQKPVEKEVTLTNFEEVLNTFLFDFANSPIEDCEPKEYIKKHSAEILKAAYKELNAKLRQDIFEAKQEGIRDGYEVAKAEQTPAHTAKEMWKEMRLEVYAQASGNRHEPNYSDDSTKMFSLCDIDEIFEKIGNSTIGSQPAEWNEEDEGMMIWLCRIIHSKKVQGEISLKDESRLGEWIDKWLNHSPQPKQEWSELDKSNLEDLIGYLNDCVHPLDFASEARFKRRMADWLKSLKPRKNEDLPMWRKWHNGACGNGNNVPIAIVKAGSGYSLTSCLGINGQEYIMLSDLDKLPKED